MVLLFGIQALPWGKPDNLKKIQKVALHIILDDQKTSYQEKCQSLNLMTLAERRTELCINFAIKLAKSNLRSEFFTFLPECKRTRSKNKIVRENLTCTKRTENAPHNYLSRLLNQNSEKLLRRTWIFVKVACNKWIIVQSYSFLFSSDSQYIGLR